MTLPDILKRVMHVDRYRLMSQWQRINHHSTSESDEKQLQRWQTAAQHSADLYEKRTGSLPKLEYDPDLPITAHRQQIIELLTTRQSIVLCGETGSGKSTQIPKMCLEAGFGRAGAIGHTQPRRLAARAVASRIADELGRPLGDLVGFKIRFSDTTSSSTLVKVMTDGVLLAETQTDRFLEHYDVLIIDEAHERSLNIDFLLGYLKRIQAKRPELKVIVTSATIDPQRFAEHLSDRQGPAPILEVSGRTYPVEVRYRPIAQSDSENSDLDDVALQRSIGEAIVELTGHGPGDILVFLPTERDIRLTGKYLRGYLDQHGRLIGTEILPLYARLSQSEQNKILARHSGRRIVLATNVAESSLTVPGIHFVIDSGLVRQSRYASRSRVQRLPIEPISQASANQRSGRCGRLGPGVCIRLYDEVDFNSRPKFTTPEIRRSDLANVLLQTYMLKLGPLEEFPLLDAPSSEAIRDAQRTLRELGAIDDRHQLTAMGNKLGKLPCDARVGRMLLEAHERQCLAEVLVIAAGLESPDVRQRPAGQAEHADSAHEQFRDPISDFLSLVRLWDFYENLHSGLGRSRLEKALHQNFLSHHAFREWGDVIRQLKDILHEADMKIGPRKLKLAPVPPRDATDSQTHKRSKNNAPETTDKASTPRPDLYAPIHQSLLAGLLSGVAVRDQKYDYKAAGGLGIRLWPGSGLFRNPPKWIVAAEIVETTQRFGRTVAELDVEWIEHAGRGLLKHSYNDPHWSDKLGAAMIYQRSTLFGLTIVAGRRMPLASLDAAAARELLIEHGLVGGQWRCSLPFYTHNLEMIADMEELTRRTRSRKYIVDRYDLINFYSEHLPVDVFDLASLRSWENKHRGSPQEKSLWLQPESLLKADEEAMDVAIEFPNSARIGAAEFPLEYHFAPGDARDGVTITVPQAALRQVSQAALGWLVPGLLEEKVLAIIRSLRKALRTHFTPAPDFAKKLTDRLNRCDRSRAFAIALAEEMSKLSHQNVRASDLEDSLVPEHLRFLVRVIDDSGIEVGQGRDVDELIARFGVSSDVSDSTDQWTNRPIRSPEDLDKIPKEFTARRGGVKVVAYVAIVDAGQSVEARLVDTSSEAELRSRVGLNRMFALINDRTLRTQVKHLPDWNRSAIALSKILSSSDLQQGVQDLIARIAFIEDRPLPLKSYEFSARQQRAVGQISIATQEITGWLPKLATNYQQLRLQLEKAPTAWSDVVAEIQLQLGELFEPGFLTHVPWRWLGEYPRYLQAAYVRLEKLPAGGLAKDRKLAGPLISARSAYREAATSPRANDPTIAQSLTDLRWTLEEFQVSLFAQQLGTKITVSTKRIQEMLGRLER